MFYLYYYHQQYFAQQFPQTVFAKDIATNGKTPIREKLRFDGSTPYVGDKLIAQSLDLNLDEVLSRSGRDAQG